MKEVYKCFLLYLQVFFVDFLGLFLGQKAEIINAPKVISTGEGREIIRTKSEGSLNVKFNVQLTNMEEYGYNI